MSGRLTLSWVNKDKALVGDGEGGYEWVGPTDPRAAEVRLLDHVGSVGDTSGAPSDNLLVRGDSLDALRALVRTPEYADEYRGKVKLVYIDPPFNTGQAFEHYDDSLEHSVWLSMMRERLVQIRELLAPDGSVWVHLDDAETAYCKVLMDEVFGRNKFVATVVWRSADTSNYDDAKFSGDHNIILVYGSSPGWMANGLDRNEQQSSHYKNPDNDPRGPWFDGNPLGSPNPRANLMYDVVSPEGATIPHPPHGWRWQKSTMDRMIEEGSVRFSSDGRRIVYRTYLREQRPLPPSNLWDKSAETGSNRKAKNELKALFGLPAKQVFATPKPERLLERVIHIGSNPGDIVLDCFAGSGTTAAVAHKMGRRWVTVELSESTASTFTRPRLEKVVAGEDPGGITNSTEWTGGGGFRELRIAGPTFTALDEEWGGGIAVVANLPADQLARSVAAQLDFTLDLESEASVFAGTRGRARLAVVVGVADDVVVDDVLSSLGDGETAVIAATSHTSAAVQRLTETRPGSRLIAVPDDLFHTPTKAVVR